MKRMKLGAALAALMWPATDAVKISCWPNASTDWDTENTCGANDVQASCVPDSTGDWDPDGECSNLPGAEAACGDDWSNPCTVLKAFDTAQSDDGHCGVCVTFKFDDSGDKALYGKIVGSEASSMWDYRVNDDSFVKIGGETGKCGSFEDVIAVLDAKEHVCPTEMTCIAPTTDWDTLNHCSTGTLVGDETTCGDSADDPCHMMATYDDDGDNPKPTAPERCGECMKLTYGEFAENEKYAKIIGLEEVTGAARDWEYRLNKVVFEAIHGSAPTCETTKAYITAEKGRLPNKDTYDNKLGGSGACGEYHSVVAVDSASDPAECPTEGDDETTTNPSGSVRAGVTLALAVAALAAA
eukprot:Polyplicarium_translucidae@DN3350_c0_g1_i12.p1